MTPRRLFWFCCVIAGFSCWAGCRKADPKADAGAPTAGAGPRTVLNYGNGTEPQDIDPQVVTGVPESYVVDAAGVIIAKYTGELTPDEERAIIAATRR